MSINFKCKKEDYPKIEMFLFSQEYKEKPEFDEIILNVDGGEYKYQVKEIFGAWFITT